MFVPCPDFAMPLSQSVSTIKDLNSRLESDAPSALLHVCRNLIYL